MLMEQCKNLKYSLSVFRSELTEIKGLYSKSENIKEADRRLNSLLNEDIIPWALWHLNHLSPYPKYTSITDFIAEKGEKSLPFKVSPSSVDTLLERIESTYISKVIEKLCRDNDLLSFEYLEGLYSSHMITEKTFEQEKNRYLRTLLRFVSFVGDNSSYYQDAQLLVFEGILDQKELDASIKRYKDMLRKL
jgi:hypothetical protein